MLCHGAHGGGWVADVRNTWTCPKWGGRDIKKEKQLRVITWQVIKKLKCLKNDGTLRPDGIQHAGKIWHSETWGERVITLVPCRFIMYIHNGSTWVCKSTVCIHLIIYDFWVHSKSTLLSFLFPAKKLLYLEFFKLPFFLQFLIVSVWTLFPSSFVLTATSQLNSKWIHLLPLYFFVGIESEQNLSKHLPLSTFPSHNPPW